MIAHERLRLCVAVGALVTVLNGCELPRDHTIELWRDCIRLQQTPVPSQEALYTQLMALGGENDRVTIVVDSCVSADAVVATMDTVRRAGLGEAAIASTTRCREQCDGS